VYAYVCVCVRACVRACMSVYEQVPARVCLKCVSYHIKQD